MSILASITGFLERRRREARTRHELEQLTDRELADLGIVRADIGRLARESADGGLVDIHTWRTGATGGTPASLARQGV